MSKHQARVVRMAVIVIASLFANAAVADDAVAWKQLSSEWWQWVLSSPVSASPLADATGANCMVGQRGTNWFLAGSFGETVTRSCDIPEGATLFFPVVNSINFDTPGQCFQGPDPIPASVYRAFAAAFVNGATNLSVTLDGRPVGPMHRTVSPVFEVALPVDNVFVAPCGGLDAGIYSPAVDDGFYVRLKPLPVGLHTLHIHAEVPAASFVLDVTYNLEVVPVVSR